MALPQAWPRGRPASAHAPPTLGSQLSTEPCLGSGPCLGMAHQPHTEALVALGQAWELRLP